MSNFENLIEKIDKNLNSCPVCKGEEFLIKESYFVNFSSENPLYDNCNIELDFKKMHPTIMSICKTCKFVMHFSQRLLELDND